MSKSHEVYLNINFHKTILEEVYSLFDPYFPTMYYNIFNQKNRKLEVWMKDAKIKYKKPKTHLMLEFNISKRILFLWN